MQIPRDRDDGQNGEVRLFSTKDAVMAVDSPIKMKILELVSRGPASFDQIVEQTGKAKSTISVHLRDLERSGLVTALADPRDSRRRIITLASDAIGRLTNEDRQARRPPAPARSRGSHAKPFDDDDLVSFFRYCVQVFRTQAMDMGINLDPVLQRTGESVGEVLAPKVAATTTEEVVQKMDAFWQSHGLGSIVLTGTDPLTLEVRGCFECEDLPLTGHGACSFDIGVLTVIFTRHLGYPVTVTEVRCYSSGDEHCTFVIAPALGSSVAQ